MLLAVNYVPAIIPILVFLGIVMAIWGLLSMISTRNSRALDRLERLSKRGSGESDLAASTQKAGRFQGILESARALASPLMPQTELEQNALKTKLANAGFRSDAAPSIYSGLRVACLGLFFVGSAAIFLPGRPLGWDSLKWVGIFTGLGFYLPSIILWHWRRKRQQEIFLTLPDALDLLVVCVESGLGLDAALRKVCDEMSEHAKIICEELSLANFQLQMGRPRREVLHDLGVRTGVDDVRSL